MKHVFNTGKIAHLWMHKTQDDARNQQGNFYFQGDTIYSYGSHFPIARHVVNAKGEAGILLTTRSYSNTTSKHIHIVRMAIHGNGVPVFHIYNVERDAKQQAEAFSEAVESETKACFGPTGRFRASAWKDLQTLVSQANAYAEFFGVRKRWEMPADTESIKAAIVKDAQRKERAEKKQAKARAKQAAERHAKQLQSLEDWKAGKAVDCYYFDHDIPTALRVVNGEVETSKGATFPVSHAARGLEFVRAHIGKGWKRNGHTFHLGNYAIDEIDLNGNVKAGCHYVEYAEIERIAPLLEVQVA